MLFPPRKRKTVARETTEHVRCASDESDLMLGLRKANSLKIGSRPELSHWVISVPTHRAEEGMRRRIFTLSHLVQEPSALFTLQVFDRRGQQRAQGRKFYGNWSLCPILL